MLHRSAALRWALPLSLLGCTVGTDPTELGSLGVGDTLLEEDVAVGPATGGPEAGKFEGVTFTLAESAAALVLANHGEFADLRYSPTHGAFLTTPTVNKVISRRPIDSMTKLAQTYGIGTTSLDRFRRFGPVWSRLGEFTPPEGTPGTAVFHLSTAQSFTAHLEQTADNAAQIEVTWGTTTLSSERATDPTLAVALPAGQEQEVTLTIRNWGHIPLAGTLTVTADDTTDPDPTLPQFEVLFTNPLCNDVSVQGARPGARCTGSEKNASRVQALSYATGAPTIVDGGVVGRIVAMFNAALAYKTAHPEAQVTIYQSYLSFYVDAGLKTALVAAINGGVKYIGYFDSNGDIAIPLELEAMNHPNIHIGWLGGHTDINGTWRLMHNKFTIVDFGVENEPTQMVFSSANLSPSGTSIHFENYLFARVARSSNFAQRHLCAIQASEADKYPSRTETEDHEVVFEEAYDTCVSNLTTEEDPRFRVFFTPDADAEALDALKQRMAAATVGVDMAIEHYSEWSLARAHRDVANHHLRARLVMDDQTLYMDGESSEGDNAMWHAITKTSGIDQRFLRTNANMNPGFQLMHNKYVVVDSQAVFMGAGNFTSAGFRTNYENFYLFELPELAAQYQMHFEHLFTDLGSKLSDIPTPVSSGSDG